MPVLAGEISERQSGKLKLLQWKWKILDNIIILDVSKDGKELIEDHSPNDEKPFANLCH